MAGVAGLEPVTSAVTGQRSNQLSYTPAEGRQTVEESRWQVKPAPKKSVRMTDAKEVGVGNPAEETCCHPNARSMRRCRRDVNHVSGFFIG